VPTPAAVELRHLAATRYVTPLREGGSLPGLVEAEDDGLYVLKFRGAGQGAKALAAELIAGELARALGLPVPDLVLLELDPAIGRAEPDAEIQDLLAASAGTNLGMDFLPGSLTYSPVADDGIDSGLAADIVWFDGLVTNVDRSPRNPNLLMWHGRLWMIDHGAALYVQHSWDDPDGHARGAFPAIAEHVLLPVAGSIGDADARLAPRVTEELLREVLAAVPDDWLGGEPAETYVRYLLRRLEQPRPFVEEAERARLALT
jgi:hypothetical protein